MNFFISRRRPKRNKKDKNKDARSLAKAFNLLLSTFGKHDRKEAWVLQNKGKIRWLMERIAPRNKMQIMRSRRAGKSLDQARLDATKKKKKKERSVYPACLPVRKTLPSKAPSQAFVRKDTKAVNKIDLLIENDASFQKTGLFYFFFVPKRKKFQYHDQKMEILKKLTEEEFSFLDYSVMQYLLNKKNKMHFDSSRVLKNLVAPGAALEASTMKGPNAQGRSLDKRIRSRIAFFLESSTSNEKESLSEAKKLTHFIRQENALRFAGRKKTTISLFPSFGATLFFLRDSFRVSNLHMNDPQKQSRAKETSKVMEEVKKMQSILSNRTKTKTLIELVKIRSLYQSASLIAKDISRKLKKNRGEFRSVFSQIVNKIPLVMKRDVEGIRICCSGRLQGAEIARTECVNFGKTSCSVLDQKRDYASARVSTRYGIVGVKVWISYRKRQSFDFLQSEEDFLQSEEDFLQSEEDFLKSA